MAAAETAAATAEMASTELSRTVSDGVSLNSGSNALNEIEMQMFVKEHLLSLMRPVNLSIEDMMRQLRNLEDDVAERHKKIDASSRQLERHANHHDNFAKDLATMRAKHGKIETDFSRMLELQSKATRQRVEGICGKLETEVQKLVARVEELERARAVNDESMSQMHQDVGELTSFSKRMDSEVADLHKKSEDLNFCNLGMSQRLEQTKVRLDDTGRDVQKLLDTTAHHQEEIKVNHSRSSRALQDLQERIVVACFDIDAQGRRLSHAEGDLEKIWKEIGTVESALAIDEENQKKSQEAMQEAMLEFQKLDTRSAIRELNRNIHEVDTRLTEVAQGASDMVKTKLAELSEGVENNRKAANDNAMSIGNVGGNLARVEQRVENAEHNIIDLRTKKDQLQQNLESADFQIKALRSDQQKSGQTLEEHARDLEKATSRVYWCEKGLENADKGIKQLSSDMTLVNDKMSRTSNHLNLAHEYLSGMTKGISDAQTHMHGMLPMKEQQMKPSLPGLPGALPRRPFTALS